MRSELEKTSLLFLGKKDCSYTHAALKFCQNNFCEVHSYLGQWGDKLPGSLSDWSGDYIISFLSRWILPFPLLTRARKAAINFHPGSPDYPGVGCVNFAIYNQDLRYGTTCHYMNPVVDSGDIIEVKYFPIFESDTVESLLNRTYAFQLCLYYEILSLIIQGKLLPTSAENWRKKAYTRKEFNELITITDSMNEEEVLKRTRAATYGKWKPVYMKK